MTDETNRSSAGSQLVHEETLADFLCDAQDRIGPGCDELALAQALLRQFHILTAAPASAQSAGLTDGERTFEIVRHLASVNMTPEAAERQARRIIAGLQQEGLLRTEPQTAALTDVEIAIILQDFHSGKISSSQATDALSRPERGEK